MLLRLSQKARRRTFPSNRAVRSPRHAIERSRVTCEALEPRWMLASTLPSGFQESVIATGIREATSMVFAPDGRIFVGEKPFGVRIVKNGALLPTPFVSLSVDRTVDRGVQSVLLDPNFTTNRFVYVFYTHTADATGVPFARLSRFTASATNPDVAEANSETVLIDKLYSLEPGYHNGGAMRFGADGLLYVVIGDLSSPTSVQDLSNLNGKLLRLNVANFVPGNPSSLIPSDNPYVNTPGARPEIYARGFRSPYSGDMKPGTNIFYINDVGAGSWEEINVAAAAANYGWPTAEGISSNPAFTNPLYAYSHGGSGAAITGGSFYTGSAFPSQYTNTYFFADYVNNWIKNINPATGVVTSFTTNSSVPVGLNQAPDGSLYWVSHGTGTSNGAIYRISYVGAGNQAPIAVANATSPTSGVGPLTVSFSGAGSSDPNGDALTYQWNFGDGTNATGRDVSHTFSTQGSYNVVLTVSDPGGLSTAAAPIVVTVGNRAPTGVISLPGSNTTYRAGDVISFSGTATDPDEGTLPATAFEWLVMFHHNVHTHHFIEPILDVTSGTFQIPVGGETDPDQWYRVHLTVTDSGGLTHSSYVDIVPQTSTFTLATNIAGLNIELDGTPRTTPATITGVVNMQRTLTAPLEQVVNGQVYEFVSWSDGSAATHVISTPATATTYTATYAARTASLPPGFQQSLYVSGLYEPSVMALLPDGRMLVAEKPHGIRVIKNGALLPTWLMALQTDQRGDRGISGLVADPNFAQNGFIYVFYTRLEGTSSFNRLSRFTIPSGSDVASPSSEVVLVNNITAVDPGYHNGGLLRFGNDGMLYVGVGEMTLTSQVQNLSNLYGKLLRLNVANYPGSIIPSDNPYVGVGGARPEIWAVGLRNPFSGDVLPGTGALYINDVGSGWEEINVSARGVNYGWPVTEGSASTDPAFTKPLYTYPHGSGVAIAGGTFYTASHFPERYLNTYFFGDYVAGFVKNIDPLTGAVTSFVTGVSTPVGLEQAPDGSLYVLTHGASGISDGNIFRITYVNQAPTAVAIATSSTSGPAPLTVNFSAAGSSDPDGDTLNYLWTFGDGATATGAVVSHSYSSVGTFQATVTVTDRTDGSGLSHTSPAITITANNSAPTGTITSPVSGAPYRAGDDLSFAGTALDPQDGSLPAAAFAWEVVLHHSGQTTSVLSSAGVVADTYHIPQTGDTSTDQWYRVHLTVTDSGGLTHTSFIDVTPLTASFTLATNIVGLALELDGITVATPHTVAGVVNMTRTLAAPLQQTIGSQTFLFVSWSDGGAATHEIATPDTSVTYTATYVLSHLGDMNGDDQVNNFDIQPFELALTLPNIYLATYPAVTDFAVRGDVNGDGQFNNFDIQPFERLLTGESGAPAALIEPALSFLEDDFESQQTLIALALESLGDNSAAGQDLELDQANTSSPSLSILAESHRQPRPDFSERKIAAPFADSWLSSGQFNRSAHRSRHAALCEEFDERWIDWELLDDFVWNSRA